MTNSKKTSETQVRRTAAGQALTDLILLIFRTGVEMATLAPAHAGDPEMTSVRWRMMNSLSGGPKTGAQLGRESGMTRQGALLNVQVLERMGYVTLIDDPHDKRAKKVALTAEGKVKLDGMSSFQAAWVNRMATKFKKADVELALTVVEELRSASLASVARLNGPGRSDSRSRSF